MPVILILFPGEPVAPTVGGCHSERRIAARADGLPRTATPRIPRHGFGGAEIDARESSQTPANREGGVA